MKKRLPKRKNKHSLKWSWRIILNAIFFLAPHLTGLGRYVQRTGCQWRYLPETFPPFLIPRRTFLPLNQHLSGFLILEQHLSGLDRLRR
jgi:transposase